MLPHRNNFPTFSRNFLLTASCITGLMNELHAGIVIRNLIRDSKSAIPRYGQTLNTYNILSRRLDQEKKKNWTTYFSMQVVIHMKQIVAKHKVSSKFLYVVCLALTDFQLLSSNYIFSKTSKLDYKRKVEDT